MIYLSRIGTVKCRTTVSVPFIEKSKILINLKATSMSSSQWIGMRSANYALAFITYLSLKQDFKDQIQTTIPCARFVFLMKPDMNCIICLNAHIFLNSRENISQSICSAMTRNQQSAQFWLLNMISWENLQNLSKSYYPHSNMPQLKQLGNCQGVRNPSSQDQAGKSSRRQNLICKYLLLFRYFPVYLVSYVRRLHLCVSRSRDGAAPSNDTGQRHLWKKADLWVGNHGYMLTRLFVCMCSVVIAKFQTSPLEFFCCILNLNLVS